MKSKIAIAITKTLPKVQKLIHELTIVTAIGATISTAGSIATSSRLTVHAAEPASEITVPIQQRNNLSDTPDVIRYALNLQDALYPETFMVTNITQETGNPNWILELTCSNGNVFLYESEDGDWFVGDLASAIMADNGTMIVSDDEIVKLTYAGFVGCDAWAYVGDRQYESEN